MAAFGVAALKQGDISLDQAAEIARAEESVPGAASDLLTVAQSESFHVLRDKARKTKLEAEQHRRSGAAPASRPQGAQPPRRAGHGAHPHGAGASCRVTHSARAEAEAQRLARKAKAEDRKEPFERFLADAYAAMLSGSGKGRAKRPELVILVSHEVATRGWTDVKDGEFCKIPGLGPVAPQVAKQIAGDAFLNGLFFDGVDLRNSKRWSRHIPVEVAIALEVGEPPEFDGVCCVDCGTRLRTEFDHVAMGPASNRNLKPRCCFGCHPARTERDRKAGKLKPPEP